MGLQYIRTKSGYAVPLDWHPATNDAATIVVMPALGTPCRVYRNFASSLAHRGFNAALIEQRGQDQSALRAGRRCDWGFAEMLANDLPAVLDWIEAQQPDADIYLLGHSLGGHYSAMAAGLLPERIRGLILVATGTPWPPVYPPKTRRQIRLLITLLPLILTLYGHYPGKRLGFGDRDARTLMRDWRRLARTNAYKVRGINRDLEAGIAAYSGPLLTLRLAVDPFAPEQAVRAVAEKFTSAIITERVITSDELGDKADHNRWAKQGEVVAAIIAEWLRG